MRWPKPMRARAETRLIVGVQEHAEHFFHQFLGKRQQPQRASSAVGFGNQDLPGWQKTEPISLKQCKNFVDAGKAHSINGVTRVNAGGECAAMVIERV